MSDEIGDIIRRDLGRLPVLPEERWVPATSLASPGRTVARGGLTLVVVACVAVVAGLSVARVRTDLLSGATASARPAPLGATLPSTIGRDQAIALVRGSPSVGRVDRIDAKLMSFEEYLRTAGPVRIHLGDPRATAVTGFGILGDPAKRYVWAVAVSGEFWPQPRIPISWGNPPLATPEPNPTLTPTPYPPYRWGIVLVDAIAGQLMTSGDAGIAQSWPPVFELLPDHPATAFVAPSPSPLASPLAVKIRGPEAMSVVMRRSAEVRRIDRIELKLMTRGEFERAQPNGGPGVYDEGAPVWVVAVGGEISLQFARGGTFSSAIFLVDANSESVVGVIASNERWPAQFDALADHGTQ